MDKASGGKVAKLRLLGLQRRAACWQAMQTTKAFDVSNEVQLFAD